MGSDQSVFVPYAGKPLVSRQQFQWRVRYRDESNKESPWSSPAHVELGLLSAKDWTAKWIRPDASKAASASGFKLISAVYRSKANTQRIQDVTALLQELIEDNTLSVIVSNKTLSGDPAPREFKELVIVYQVEGNESTAVLDEGEKGTYPESDDSVEKVAWLRREFSVSGNVERARLYVTARGLVEVHLNGDKVGQDVFAPGWTSYANRIDTLTYDVTQNLKRGKNAIGALLGTGWYAGRLRLGAKNEKHIFGQYPEILLQLEITFRDGSKKIIVSDENWKATQDGPIRSSSLYDGETYDARKEMPGWDQVGFTDSLWGDSHGRSGVGAIGP